MHIPVSNGVGAGPKETSGKVETTRSAHLVTPVGFNAMNLFVPTLQDFESMHIIVSLI